MSALCHSYRRADIANVSEVPIATNLRHSNQRIHPSEFFSASSITGIASSDIDIPSRQLIDLK
jgi:hypothetical protein